MNRQSAMRNTVRPRVADPKHAQMDGRVRGHTPAVVPPGGREPKPVDIAVRDRSKFFKHTHISSTQQIQLEGTYTSTSYVTCNAKQGCKIRPTHRTVEVQTDYRDSEAQTDPYSPDYKIKPGENPEIVTLTQFTYGNGLPAGLREVEIIKRAREQREWEATLPPFDDLTQTKKRRMMVQERNVEELVLMKQELENLQEDCYTEQAEQEAIRQMQMNNYFCKLQIDKEERLQKIGDKFARSMRKVTEMSNTKKEKTMRLVSRFSQTYESFCHQSPLAGEQPQHSIKYIDTYQGLQELEADLPSSVLEQKIKASKPKKKGSMHGAERREAKLLKACQAMQDKKAQVEEKKPLRFLERLPKVEKPAPRPPTPVVEAIPEEEEEKELAVIFQQKLLRGRSIQVQMLKDREKHMELIQEVCVPPEVEERQRAYNQALERKRELYESMMSKIEGPAWAVIGDMLDFFPKELVRIEQERKIRELILKAEQERCRREAKESRLRQVEEQRRREEDEIFRQVMNVHKATTNLYLDDLIHHITNETAEAQASEEMHYKAEELNDNCYTMEKTMNPEQSENIVAGMVNNFLLPEVDKIMEHGGTVTHPPRGRRNAVDSSSTGPPSLQTKAASNVLSQAIEEVEKTQHADQECNLELANL